MIYGYTICTVLVSLSNFGFLGLITGAIDGTREPEEKIDSGMCLPQ